MNIGVVRRTAAVLVVSMGLCGFLAACGTGGEQGPPPFEISAVGPGGATVAAGDVTVVFPANAFAQQTQVSILPEANPLPFIVAPGDPCTYAYLGPLWCVGPVGHNVAVPSQLIVLYNPATLPAGKTEDDLFLFTWDDAAQVLRLAVGAVQDQAANHFVINNYVELGHLAVMVRTCTGPQQPRINPVAAFILGQNNPFAISVDGGNAAPGLYVVDVDADLGDFPPTHISTNNAIPDFIATSRDGTRVLYGVNNSDEGTDWFNVTVQGGTPVTVGAGDNIQTSQIIGWWGNTGGSTDAFYQYFQPDQIDSTKIGAGSGQLIGPNRSRQRLEIQLATDDATQSSLHAVLNGASWSDMRQAPDDQHILVRVGEFGDGFFEYIEIVDAENGDLISSEDIPLGGGVFTPRFAADGQSVFYVNFSRDQAIETNFDHTTTQVVFDIAPQQTGAATLLDFAPAPDGEHFVAIERTNFTQGSVGDTLHLGLMDGQGGWTVLESENLGDQYFYGEVVWSPESTHVYLSVSSGSVGIGGVIPVTIDPAASNPDRIIVNPTIPAFGMSGVDINATDGRLLVTVISLGQTISPGTLVGPQKLGLAKIGATPSTHFTSPGLWVSDPDGTNARMILNGIDGTGISNPARWLEDVRNTPGSSDPVR